MHSSELSNERFDCLHLSNSQVKVKKVFDLMLLKQIDLLKLIGLLLVDSVLKEWMC